MFCNRWFKIFGIMVVIMLITVNANAANVKDFGAIGDANTDDTEAFIKAAKSDYDVFVPAGTYLIKTFSLPENHYLHGVGNASVIKFKHEKIGSYAVGIGSGCKVSNVRFTATEPFIDWLHGSGSQGTGLLRILKAKNVSIDQVTLDNYRHMGIWITESEIVRITNCHMEKLDQPILIEFSQRIQVIGNTISETANHGIQFWGNWKWETKVCSDLLFANNYIYRGGDTGIWGTGATRVVMVGNIVHEARDVGLDLEWVDDSTISGNTVRGSWNAGISLFYTCANVSITGNTVVITEGREGRRDGIWLTPTNKKTFPKDNGHQNVSITGNTIIAEGKSKHGINIGSGSNIVCAANTMQNADFLDKTGNVKVLGASSVNSGGQGKETLADYMTVLPFSQEWKFQIDPNDEGVTKTWFSKTYDVVNWSSIRSDKNGDGWEAQGFGGKDGKGYTGFAWYRAELPKLPEKLRTFFYLYFGMVDEQTWIYLNDAKIGEHTVESENRDVSGIWSEPFNVDISKTINKDGPNVLAVRVHNAALHGGIREPVYLIMADRPLLLTEQLEGIKVLVAPR